MHLSFLSSREHQHTSKQSLPVLLLWPLNTLHLYIGCSLFAPCLPLLLRLFIQFIPSLICVWILYFFNFFFYFPDNFVVRCSTAKWVWPWNVQGKFHCGNQTCLHAKEFIIRPSIVGNFNWGMLSNTWDAAICIHPLSAGRSQERFFRRSLIPSWRHHLIDWLTS